MLVKKPDGSTDQLDTLIKLTLRDGISEDARHRVIQATDRFSTYVAGHEALAAGLDALFADSEQWALIHDLRLELGGEVAHIDHLLINRMFEGWVMTGGQFSEGLVIPSKGLPYAYVGGARAPTASPLVETRRCVAMLNKLLASQASELTQRVGTSIVPRFHPLTLVTDKAHLDIAPKSGALPEIVRLHELPEFLAKHSPARPTLESLARTVSPGILVQLAEHLVGLHCAHIARYQSLQALGLTEADVTAKELFALSEALSVFPDGSD